jgi:ATPase subunit of ABC transporter with duplicated ATPase domains
MADQIRTNDPRGRVVAAGLTLTVAGRRLLDGAEFALAAAERVALVGRNGSGKSTLLGTVQALADGGRPPEHVELSGSLTFAPGTIVASLPQSPQLAFPGPARAYLDRCAGEPARAWARHEDLVRRLAAGDQGQALLDAYGEALEAMDRHAAWDLPRRIAEVTAGLSLGPELLERPLAELSGGQATRLALAGVLISPANLLLLDEPSNNLDLESLGFLSGWITSSPAALLMVSHDRELIDATIREVWEVEEHTGRLRRYGGGYTFYAERKREEREALLRRYEDQEARRRQLEASARGVSLRAGRFQSTSQNDFYRSKGAKVMRQATAQRARIERELGRVEEPEPPAVPRLTVPAADHRPGLLARADGLGLSYGSLAVLRGIDLQVRHGDRLAVVGPNGSGKSTLLRLLAGELAPTSGTVERRAGLRVGHLPQAPEAAAPGTSLLDFALRRFNGPAEELRPILGKVLMGDPARARAADASLGELRRIECAALFAGAPDLAILDEPTNHLDLLSIEMLESALDEYRGALVVVSHDRRFLDHVRPTATLRLAHGRGG